MANKHFGNVGDVFKHYLLAEALTVAEPSSYMETHAGSTYYSLSESKRRYADWRSFTSRKQPPTPYKQVLDQAIAGGIYPGSAVFAIKLLPVQCQIRLYDLDIGSVESLIRASLLTKNVTVKREDGLAAALESPAELTLIDPFRVYDGQPDSVSCFENLSQRGNSVILWYPLLTAEERCPVAAEQIFQLQVPEDQIAASGGLAGCGFAVANLPEVVSKALNCGMSSLQQTLPELQLVTA